MFPFNIPYVGIRHLFSETCYAIFRVEPPRVLKEVGESWGREGGGG